MPNVRPPLILIAADDQAVCEALQFALRLEGLSVRTHRAAAALLMDPDLPAADCVILDDCKPYMDGFAMLNQLRARAMRMPVILLTSQASGRLRVHAINDGVRIVLEKPLLDNALVDSIHTILSGVGGTGHL